MIYVWYKIIKLFFLTGQIKYIININKSEIMEIQ